MKKNFSQLIMKWKTKLKPNLFKTFFTKQYKKRELEQISTGQRYMASNQIQLIQESWQKVLPIAPQAADIFYRTLFELDPKLQNLFSDDIEAQGKKLMAMIDAAIKLLDEPDKLVATLQKLGERHKGYGVKEGHYRTVGAALIKTLEIGLAEAFTNEVEAAWKTLYQKMADTMIAAANAYEQSAGEKGDNMDDAMSTENNELGAFIQAALEQSSTAFMMINRDFVVTYVNQATMNLLSKNEHVFQQKWPKFSAEKSKVIGTCIDTFHEKPAHQRQLLSDPNNLPYKTDIRIEHLIIELNVTAILDSNGEYIGNSLEWQDVTKERAQENQAVQLHGAIEQSGTPTMMIDRNFNITYINKATLNLLKKHELTFQQNWPGFIAEHDQIVGINIDGFHKNPQHQRKLLADQSNLPYSTDIKIGDLIFELNVTAIIDVKGDYIGNSLEWQDVTDTRNKSLQVGRLTSAVEGMTTNMMMADVQGNIVYANPAVLKMLKRREEQLRKVLPSFNVDTIVGTNFDSFHKNPSHQQNLLGNPANLPYTAEISVAGLMFELIAIALLDEEGNHVGSAVQWLDITEQKDAENQVDKLIKDAISGQLDSRIDTSVYEGFMKGLGDNINSLMNAIVEPISDAINIAQSLANGDLTKNMDGEYAGEFLALANAMNGSIDKLSTMVDEIRNGSNSVFEAAREIAQGNNELSHRTETQASSLEETASAMEELTSTVQQNAENATEASKLAGDVMRKATNGGSVVKSAIEAMSDINKSSKKIADIISVIDEIAFQTNLLALNAAVEAARAGEQGRGFAVVAAEVRNLAQRSAGAAKEIKALINDSVEAVGQGTKLVDETGQTFSELVNAVENVSTMISDIDSAGKEQSAGIGEVSAAVSQMDEMTQQNAALVEEASASSKSMEDQAQLLLEQVGFFNNGNSGTAEVKSEPETQLHSVGSSVTPIPTIKPKARQAVPSDQEWEEF